ncbi:MAG: DUF5060 domain-containing protein [Planctomycetota bacterium]|jgi:hypothetical protein
MVRMLNCLSVVLVGLASQAALGEAAGAGPSILSVQTDTQTVGMYEKFELRIDLKARYANPFDPDQIDVWAEFTSPSGETRRIWGFYSPSSWASLWMVRFAPTETGTWQYVVHAADREGSARSDVGELTAVESAHHGFLTIAPNQRYLRYSDGTSFYGVGMWYNDSYELFGQGRITEAGLDELIERGANFISFFPTPLETMGTGLGRYDQNRCGRLDQLVEWCEGRGLHISWNLWFHSYLSEAVWGGGNSRYRNNPYRLVADSVDFFGSEEAWKYQEHLYRYIMARWGYSRAVFLWFVVDEINGTEGWMQGDQSVAEEWCRKVDRFYNEHDPYGRPTTGTQSGGIGQWWPGGYRIFDVAAREIYEAQGHPMPKSGKPGPDDDSPLRYSYRTYATQAQNLWNGFPKPALIGECGWDHTYYEPGMPGYLAMYHNALWVSLANGLCATPFWWSYSDRINDSVVTNQMLHFSRFVSDIDFADLDLQPAEITAGDCDAWAMKSDRITFGWVVNPRTSVANESFTILKLPDGEYEVQLYRTWRGSYLKEQKVACRDGILSVTIPELKTTRGHASHIGHDVAFKILPR